MKILMTGGTGLIGRELGKALVQAGHKILLISRSKNKSHLPFPCEVIEADLNQGPCQDSRLKSVEAVVHLAGENVGDGRWTEARKKAIFYSRVDLTGHLFDSLKESKSLVSFVSAGAIGFYGDRGEELLKETSAQGSGFLAEVCGAWENAVFAQKTLFPQVRFAILRTGVVLSPQGGALAKMIQPFRFGIGGALGHGKQWVSWIHLQDLIKIYLKAIDAPELHGSINAVSPCPVTNEELTRAIAQVMGKRVGPSVPAFILKLALGEMSSIVLDSTRVEPTQLQDLHFSFEFSKIEPALRHCLSSFS